MTRRLALHPSRRIGAACRRGSIATMADSAQAPRTIDSIIADLGRAFPEFAPTPLLDLSALATELGIAQVLAKNEGRRPLGNFKSLGGTYGALRALAGAAGTDVEGLLGTRRSGLPAVICASDGNHRSEERRVGKECRSRW